MGFAHKKHHCCFCCLCWQNNTRVGSQRAHWVSYRPNPVSMKSHFFMFSLWHDYTEGLERLRTFPASWYSEKSPNSTQKRLFIAYFQWFYSLFVHSLSNQSKNCPEDKKVSENHFCRMILSWKCIKKKMIRGLGKKLDFFENFQNPEKISKKNLRFFLLKIIWKIKKIWIFEISIFPKFLIFHMISNIKNLRFFREFFQDF